MPASQISVASGHSQALFFIMSQSHCGCSLSTRASAPGGSPQYTFCYSLHRLSLLPSTAIRMHATFCQSAPRSCPSLRVLTSSVARSTCVEVSARRLCFSYFCVVLGYFARLFLFASAKIWAEALVRLLLLPTSTSPTCLSHAFSTSLYCYTSIAYIALFLSASPRYSRHTRHIYVSVFVH